MYVLPFVRKGALDNLPLLNDPLNFGGEPVFIFSLKNTH